MMESAQEGNGTNQPLTILRIQRAVAEHWGVSVCELQTSCDLSTRAFHQQVGSFLAVELTQASFPEIAQAFGREHTTARLARIHIARWMEEDAQVAHMVWRLRQTHST